MTEKKPTYGDNPTLIINRELTPEDIAAFWKAWDARYQGLSAAVLTRISLGEIGQEEADKEIARINGRRKAFEANIIWD